MILGDKPKCVYFTGENTGFIQSYLQDFLGGLALQGPLANH